MSIRSWFDQRSNPLIGLDIGSDFVKMLAINTTNTPYRIEFFAVSAVPNEAIVKNEIKNPAAIAQVLKNLIREANLKSPDVALSIPRSSAIIKNVTVDNRLTAEEIESRAWIEANQHFPELVGDIYLDFTLLGASKQDPAQSELLLVACRKELILPYIEICKLAGINLKIIDINSFALERALISTTTNTPLDNKTIALLNIDYHLSTFIVVQDKTLIYAHDQSFDGKRLKAQLANLNQANQSQANESAYFSAFSEVLSAHLRHTLHFFYTSRPNISIEQIFLSGDSANIPFLSNYISKESGLKTEVATPFNNIDLGTINIESFKQYESSLMLCYGLGLSKVE